MPLPLFFAIEIMVQAADVFKEENVNNPDWEKAEIYPSKVRDYLLSPTHPVGRFKAPFFAALGYTQDEWNVLQDDLREIIHQE